VKCYQIAQILNLLREVDATEKDDAIRFWTGSRSTRAVNEWSETQVSVSHSIKYLSLLGNQGHRMEQWSHSFDQKRVSSTMKIWPKIAQNLTKSP